MEEGIQDDIEAIEEEKQEYLEGNLEEDEEVNVEETEFNLTGDEIDVWLIRLMKLKEQKTPIELEIDEENILKVNFDEGE